MIITTIGTKPNSESDELLRAAISCLPAEVALVTSVTLATHRPHTRPQTFTRTIPRSRASAGSNEPVAREDTEGWKR